MSYQVLARKWRPRSFREMVGQTHVLKALINALDNERLHHAYLFTGTRGVGKTTIARILAKCLNCETGISSTPCGTCSVCREIDEGRFVDLIEVDAASRTKVEDTRELLENVQYAPSRGRYKVYLIDEVHMLSTHSFNALLKTLEEPPPHVKFLLATTDPQKLPVTILSRCLQFALKNMPPERVVAHLQQVLAAESIPFEDDALWLLGRAADGSMRDAMSLTDQAIAFGEGKVLATDVRAMLGTLDHGQVYDVLQALLEGDGRAVLEAVRHLAEQGPDWSGVLAELLNVLHRVAIAQVLPDAVDNGQGDRERVLTLAQSLPAEDVQYYYQLGLVGRRDLPLAPDPRHGFEMVLLRMLAFRPAGAAIPERPALKTTGASPATADSDQRPVAAAAPTPLPAPAVAPAPVPATPASSNTTPTEESVDLPWEEPAPVATKAAPAPAPAPAPVEVVATPVVPKALPTPQVEATPEATVIAELPADTSGDDLDGDEEPPPAEDYYEVGLDDYLDSLGEPAADEIAMAPAPDVQPATGLAADWLALFPELKLGGLTASIAANCTLVALEGDHWHLHLDPAQSALFNANQQRRLNDALNQQQGRTITLQVTIQAPEQETPAQAAARRRAERQRQAEQSIQDDPLIRQMMQQFAATVRAGTIEPVDTQA
ncbi:DNA polymerase III subunit gamma/tau [Pseudomonas oryzihabitans]|uniref:DNA polymerase III subunit gamma/tau n=1 Tax=Pseudomonas oryzihabitans TaxID=47885 RepID=UPI0028954423|nr:DNA polymerase III subunit gamma/tau [Pseudomonas oryzihabitans]MDT3720603.1 DNA polymerase III subunit gamma/tau [Pseudomonas oryzihabitans]